MTNGDGFGEGFQQGFTLDDASSFSILMFELYGFCCAVTGETFAARREPIHPELEVFLFRPISEGGRLSFDNAIVVSRPVGRLMEAGRVVVGDDLVVRAGGVMGNRLLLPTDRAFWPSPEALRYHRHKVLPQG